MTGNQMMGESVASTKHVAQGDYNMALTHDDDAQREPLLDLLARCNELAWMDPTEFIGVGADHHPMGMTGGSVVCAAWGRVRENQLYEKESAGPVTAKVLLLKGACGSDENTKAWLEWNSRRLFPGAALGANRCYSLSEAMRARLVKVVEPVGPERIGFFADTALSYEGVPRLELGAQHKRINDYRMAAMAPRPATVWMRNDDGRTYTQATEGYAAGGKYFPAEALAEAQAYAEVARKQYTHYDGLRSRMDARREKRWCAKKVIGEEVLGAFRAAKRAFRAPQVDDATLADTETFSIQGKVRKSGKSAGSVYLLAKLKGDSLVDKRPLRSEQDIVTRFRLTPEEAAAASGSSAAASAISSPAPTPASVLSVEMAPSDDDE